MYSQAGILETVGLLIQDVLFCYIVKLKLIDFVDLEAGFPDKMFHELFLHLKSMTMLCICCILQELCNIICLFA